MYAIRSYYGLRHGAHSTDRLRARRASTYDVGSIHPDCLLPMRVAFVGFGEVGAAFAKAFAAADAEVSARNNFV